MIAMLVVCGLAAWRVAHLLVYEDGPWHVFDRLRVAAGVPVEGVVEGFWAELLTCMWCATVWTAPLMFAAWLVSPIIPGMIAIAAVAAGLIRGSE